MTGLFEADIDSALQTDCGITETPGSPHFVSPPPGLWADYTQDLREKSFIFTFFNLSIQSILFTHSFSTVQGFSRSQRSCSQSLPRSGEAGVTPRKRNTFLNKCIFFKMFLIPLVISLWESNRSCYCSKAKVLTTLPICCPLKKSFQLNL